MSLLIPVETGADEFDDFVVTEFELGDKNYFILSNKREPTEKIRVLFPFECKDIAAPYTVQTYLFKNKHVSQNDVIELKISPLEKVEIKKEEGKKDKVKSFRIGYIFMLNALLEPENSPFNEHTFSFAYYSFEKLVSGEASCKPKIPHEKKDEYNLADFYETELSCVVICDQNTESVQGFNFEHYLFDLFLYGFSYVMDQNKKIRINNSAFIADKFETIKSTSSVDKQGLNITKAPFTQSEISYPITLIKSLISEESHFLTRFHTLYQVFEMLIDDILKSEIKLQICAGTEDLPGHKLKEKVSKLATEGYRVNLLITRYSKTSTELTLPLTEKLREVLTHINPLYQESGEQEPRTEVDDTENGEDKTEIQATKLAGLIVKLRNDLVHNYRSLHSDPLKRSVKELLVTDIVDDLELVCCEVLISFGRQERRKIVPQERTSIAVD
jgi:hypothetical protein